MNRMQKLGLLIVFCAINIQAMRMSQQGRTNAQYYWKQKQNKELQQKQDQELKQQMQQDRRDFFVGMQNDDNFVKFNEHLKEDVVAKGWFQGPSKQWKDKTIVLAFDLLESYKGVHFNMIHSYIKSHVCRVIDDYDKKCYFHLYDRDVCNEIITDLDQLMKYAVSGARIEPTFGNKLLFGRVLERQDYYDQLLKERNQNR
jgi:hypothetical protein